MTGLRSIMVATLALWLAACATLSPEQRDQAASVAAQARASTVDCAAADACAQPSPLRRGDHPRRRAGARAGSRGGAAQDRRPVGRPEIQADPARQKCFFAGLGKIVLRVFVVG